MSGKGGPLKSNTCATWLHENVAFCGNNVFLDTHERASRQVTSGTDSRSSNTHSASSPSSAPSNDFVPAPFRIAASLRHVQNRGPEVIPLLLASRGERVRRKGRLTPSIRRPVPPSVQAARLRRSEASSPSRTPGGAPWPPRRLSFVPDCLCGCVRTGPADTSSAGFLARRLRPARGERWPGPTA